MLPPRARPLPVPSSVFGNSPQLNDDVNEQETLPGPTARRPEPQGAEDKATSDGHQTYINTDSAEEWLLVYAELKRRDEQMVTEYREEVDTLLVFAGLFSAVLTAFVVESYQSLNRDNTQTTVDLLLKISQQLADTSTPAAVLPDAFQPTSSNIRVNIYWFLGLVLSLTSALFGFLMKQWLKMYISWIEVSPFQDAVGLRQYRYEGMLRWQLPNVFTALPMLLQVALVLFLIGLVDFLLDLQQEVAVVVSVMIGICLWAVVVTTVLPSIVPNCPFRSPLSHLLLQARIRLISFLYSLRRLRRTGWWNFRFQWNLDDGTWRQHWRDLDLARLKEEDNSQMTACEAPIRSVHYLWTVCQDEILLRKISSCLYEPQLDGRRRMSLERCWPIISALRGFHGPRGLFITWRLIGRAGAMSIALRQLLARMILDAAATEHAKFGDEPTRSWMLDDALRLLSVLLFRVNDASVIADYMVLLHSAIPSRLDEVESATLSDTSIFVPMTMFLHGPVYRCDKVAWQAADSSKFVRSAASIARECHTRLINGLFLDFVQLALSVAVTCCFDHPKALDEDAEALRDILWVIERLIDRGTKGFDVDRLNQWLDRFRHPLHILLARRRNVLPVPLVCNLALNLGHDDFDPEGTSSDEEWSQLWQHLVSTCVHPGCGAKPSRYPPSAQHSYEGAPASLPPLRAPASSLSSWRTTGTVRTLSASQTVFRVLNR